MFIVPTNFGMVHDAMYRGAMPEAKHLPFLATLTLRTVVVLAPEGPPPALAAWAAEHGIRCVHPPSVRSGRGTALSETAATEVLSLLVDEACQPVLVTCAMGRYRTGVVVGCLRKLQRWNLVAILEEYRRFTGGKARPENAEFIELYDASLIAGAVQQPAAS
jgi:tyrosine-protein phosphatase OCA1